MVHHKLLSKHAFLGSWAVELDDVIFRALDGTYMAWNPVNQKFSVNVITNSTPCNHFQEYNTCVLSCYLQEPFTWLEESKRADRTTTKTSLSTSPLKMKSHALQLIQPMENSYNQHSTQCHFIFHHWLSPTCMFSCAWENTLIKVFVGSNDQ